MNCSFLFPDPLRLASLLAVPVFPSLHRFPTTTYCLRITFTPFITPSSLVTVRLNSCTPAPSILSLTPRLPATHQWCFLPIRRSGLFLTFSTSFPGSLLRLGPPRHFLPLCHPYDFLDPLTVIKPLLLHAFTRFYSI